MKNLSHETKQLRQLLLGLVALAASFTATAQNINAELVADTCSSCHGPGGASLGPATPVLAGMSRNYLIGAMLAYKYAEDISAAQNIIDADDALQDVIIFSRPSTIMNTIAKAYSADELKAVAAYFEAQEVPLSHQDFDSAMADAGRRIHNKYCEKCHEDGGRSSSDDVGLLSGQWHLYLNYTLEDFNKGHREMPKKMSEKMDAMQESLGDSALDQLAHFYASQSK